MNCLKTTLYLIMIFSLLFSWGFTAYYVISEDWISGWRNFGICPELPVSLALCMIGNVVMFIYCVCKLFCKCSPCCFFFNMITFASYIFSYYVVIKNVCYDDYIHTYPKLLYCFWTQIVMQTIVCIMFVSSLCVKSSDD
jgi:hypothetical protein